MEGSCPSFRARICIFWAWNTLACSIHFATVVGIEDMESIIVASCWSSLRENWSIRVTSSEIPALEVRFWKSVMYFWNPSSIIPSGHLNDFCVGLVSSNLAVALVS